MGWRMGTNLRSTEIGYGQLQCVPLHLCFTSLHLCFLNFLPEHQTPTWDCKNSLASGKNWDLSNQNRLLNVFRAISFLASAARLFLAPHICKYMVSSFKCFRYQNIQSPKETAAIIYGFGGNPCDFTSKHGNSSSNPARFAQDVLCSTL